MKPNLSTSYLGLQLKNPFIVSSSGLTSTFDKVKACVEAGAAAVVLKSIFEEQMASEAAALEQYSSYPEAADYLSGYVEHNALQEYITLIEKCSHTFTIPIIASINCHDAGTWVDYAQHIEKAGAAAIELNIFTLPGDPNISSAEIDAHYLAVIERVKRSVSIPIAIKIPSSFSAPLNIVQQLYYRGVKGVAMFNRFYSPDIDIERMKVISAGVFSHHEELYHVLRWVAMASTAVPLIDIVASTGVHSGEAAVKALLSGARAVEVCSALYEQGVDYLSVMIADMERWMERHSIDKTSDFIGKLNAESHKNAEIYERAQFMKYFSAKANTY